MQFSQALRTGWLLTALGMYAHAQTAPAKEPPAETKNVPPRAAPTEYQAHAKAGDMTIGAEFTGHSIATLDGTLDTDDYVVVEIGLFGPPDAQATLSADDFSLRINGKKNALPSQPYGLVIPSVKDPEWAPPAAPQKSKGGLTGGGGGEQGGSNEPPPPVVVPFSVQRANAQKVQRSILPEGDRTLPQAGLLFFEYRGKRKGIHSVELIYAGKAGKATLPLRP